MKCTQCGFENDFENKFCIACGKRLALRCPHCKSEIKGSVKFCGECGHDLSKSADPPSIDYSHLQSRTSKYLTEKMLTPRSSIEGERKLVTLLFADVVNYTSIAEKLDPEEVRQIMDGCFKILMNEIHLYEGAINRFTGDGVMSLFGAPISREDHVIRACHAALAVQKAMKEYGDRIERDYSAEFKMRIGLHSGFVVVGSIGDDLRMDYTAVGDTANFASRMQNLAEPGGILVSENIRKAAGDFFEFVPAGKIELKGKEKTQKTHKLIKSRGVKFRFDVQVAKGLTRFVGRRNTCAALKEAYEKAVSGFGQVVGLVGDAGVGKSRVLLEMRNRLPQDQFTYHQGRCFHFGTSIAYLPFLDILRAYFNIEEGDPGDLAKQRLREGIASLDDRLRSTLPAFQDLFSVKVDEEGYRKLEPKQKRERIFEAVRDFLIRLSHQKPLVIAVEDLHWIDRTSEELLDYFIGSIANFPVLVILLYRPEYVHPWGSNSCYSRIGVTELTAESSADLVKAVLAEQEVMPEITELILDRSSGNPLFIEELVRNLLENSYIRKVEDRYVLSRKVSEIQMPETIQGLISSRLDRLEPNLKRVLQMASVIGRDFTFQLLQSISGMRDELKFYLLSLQGLEFIYEKSLFPELEFVFKHVLTQQVAYNSLLVKNRKEIHENTARAIECIYSERLEEFYEMLAYHYSKSENSEQAYKYLKLSGQKAVQDYSNWEALRFFKEALEVLHHLPETERKRKALVQIYLTISGVMTCLMFPQGSLEILRKGERVLKRVADKKSLARLYGAIGFYYSFKADFKMAQRYTENRFKEAEEACDLDLMAPVAISLCSSYYNSGEYYRALDVTPRVIQKLEKTHRETDTFGTPFNLYSMLHAYEGGAWGMMGNFEAADTSFDKSRAFALKVNNLAVLACAEFYHGTVLCLKGDGREADVRFKSAIKYSEDAQFMPIVGMAWAFSGWAHFLQGEPETAKSLLQKGLGMQTRIGRLTLVSCIHLLLGMVHFDLHNEEEARICAEKSLELARKNREKHWVAFSKIWLARILGNRGVCPLEQALGQTQEGIKVLEKLKLRPWSFPCYLHLAELYAASGHRERAAEILEKAKSAFQQMGMDYWEKKAHGVLTGL